MKKFLISILLVVASLCSYAQKAKPMNLPKLDSQIIHFGYSLALNRMDFGVRPSDTFYTDAMDSIYSVEVGRFVGFNINIISNVRLGKYFDLRFLPGLAFGQRNLHYKYVKDNMYYLHTMMIESTYFEFPLSIKYKAARISNWRPFVIAGANARIDMASQKKIKPEEYPKIRLKRFDAFYEFGAGVDFFLEYFMFGVELKASFGIRNDVLNDNSQYSEYFRKLNSRMIILAFHFEGGKLDFVGKKRRRQ